MLQNAPVTSHRYKGVIMAGGDLEAFAFLLLLFFWLQDVNKLLHSPSLRSLFIGLH